MKSVPVPAVFILCFLSVQVTAATIHVPSDQPTIQAAIDAVVDGDTVLVADGVWTGPGNRDLDFAGKSVTVGSLNGPVDCIIDCEGQGRGFHFHSGEDLESVVRGFTIRNGIAFDPVHAEGGGGILIDGAAPLISGCILTSNNGTVFGGGCNVTSDSGGLIADCVFRENTAAIGGGLALGGDVEARNCLVTQNDAFDMGGGICTRGGNQLVLGCTITENHCVDLGGGIGVWYSNLTMDNCIIWGNDAELEYPLPSDEGFLGGDSIISYSYNCFGDVWYVEDFVILDPGPGNIGDDPLFTMGPEGDWYLSQVAAGQAVESPCIDTGDPLAELIDGTTRTDLLPDTGVVDMGFHYPFPLARTRLVTGPGPGYDNPPLVHVFFPHDNGPLEYEFSAYGAPHYGINVTSGDVDGDTIDEVLTGPGPGAIYGPHVRGFDTTGTDLPGLNFLAYGTNKYGVNVATGDLDGGGNDEILTGAGPGAVFGPHVRGWVYNGPSGVTPYPGVSYFAYGTPKWGVNVSAGDIDGDGYDEIVTGPGPGALYGPHVRGWNVDGKPAVTAIPEVSFFAYGTLKYGVNVSCGDVDGDGIDEIVTGAGPGAVFGPHVRGWNFDGATVASLPGFSFFAWLTGSQSFGVNVFAGTDLNDDGLDDVIAGRGPDPEADTQVKVFAYDGTTVTEWMALEAYSGMTHGANVAAGRL
jgi:hypothetical protein